MSDRRHGNQILGSIFALLLLASLAFLVTQIIAMLVVCCEIATVFIIATVAIAG